MQTNIHQPTQLDCQTVGSNLVAVVDFRETNNDDEICAWLLNNFAGYDFALHTSADADVVSYDVLVPQGVSVGSNAAMKAGA